MSYGRMAERSKAPDSGSGLARGVGSNPTSIILRRSANEDRIFNSFCCAKRPILDFHSC